MTFARFFSILAVGLCLAFSIQAMARSNKPATVVFETGAWRAWPVIYQFTVNNVTVGLVNDALSSAEAVPPTNGASYAATIPRLQSPRSHILETTINWTELSTGRHYTADFEVDEDAYSWFKGEGIPLYVTFGQHGAYTVRTLSKARVTEPVVKAIELDDMDIVAEGCARRTATKAWSETQLKTQLQQVFGHDAEFVEKHRNDALPEPRCPNPGR
ncbi:hypothetical protein [Tritonibacter mobilis]|uniref:hypothetical protein n=1 Tax=Tritonibacter mobilis TaxID=379347 RepID=UPI000806C9D5|nr:hypothetical protein [Tritonibacter mobilis]SDW48242.1 hypothetical protein SAMN05444385_102372 [Tritonibacter mobilis]